MYFLDLNLIPKLTNVVSLCASRIKSRDPIGDYRSRKAGPPPIDIQRGVSKGVEAGLYGNEYPRTPLSFTQARHAQPFYTLRAGHP
jgi:hypothetical protein